MSIAARPGMRSLAVLLVGATLAGADEGRVLLAASVDGGPSIEGFGGGLGTALEVDVQIWNRISARAQARYQHYKNPPDECDWYYEGERIDLGAGVRVDIFDPSTFHRARPFFATTIGASLFRFDGYCSHRAANLAYLDGVLGLDLFVARHVALRFYLRTIFELTKQYLGTSPFDGGVGLAARF